MIFWQLYISFFKIGLFGFGGGYAMLSLIQNEVVVKHQWLTDAEFTDIVAISQMTPGPISINIATYSGYSVTDSILGSVIATVAVCTPSFIIMFILALLYKKLKDNNYIKQIMKSLSPVVIGLILAAFLLLCTESNFSDYKSYIIFIVALVLSICNVNPIIVLIISGSAGFFIY